MPDSTVRPHPMPVGVALAGIPAPGALVGGLFKVRRALFKTEPFAVISQSGHDVTGIWASGETETLPTSKVKTPLLPADGLILSHAGRLWALLSAPSTGATLTDELRSALTASYQSLVSQPGHAIGLVLDRQRLGLTIDYALKLPIESWRVHYEYLSDFPPGSPERRTHAEQIAADEAAPSGIRLRVAVVEGLASDGGDEGARVLLTATPARLAEVQSAAQSIASQLAQSGVPGATVLREAADLAPSAQAKSTTALALAVADGAAFDPAAAVRVVGLPSAVIDDLIDRGVRRFDFAGVPTEAAVDGLPDVPLKTYVLARIAPTSLSSLDVVRLKFAAEGYRRYLEGDDAVAEAMPPARQRDAEVARALRRGDVIPGEPTDTHLRELVGAVNGSGIAESHALLNDRSVWGALVGAGVTGVGPEELSDLAALHVSRSKLFEWDWEGAVASARDGLRTAKREIVRDELLNILACALWMQDRPEQALSALDTALEGEYSDALLTNAAVVATELEHSEAVDRFVRLAGEAAGPQQRALAAEKALILWKRDDARLWEDDADDIPEEIIEVLRPLIAEPIGDERYERVLRVLAENDEEWFAAQPITAFGAHSGKPMVRVLKARAEGIDKFVEALGKELRTNAGTTDPWLESERDSLVGAATGVLIENITEIGAAVFGMTIVEANLPMKPVQRVPLVCLTVTAISMSMDTSNGEPKGIFIDWVLNAKSELSSLAPDDRERMSSMVTLAGESLARSYADARSRQLDQAVEIFNGVLDKLRLIPSYQVNHQAVQALMSPISELCRESWDVLNKVRALVSDTDLLRWVDSVMAHASDLGNKAVKIR